MRVHEVAKSLDKTSKEVIEFLRSQNVAVASHASSLDDEHVEMVKAKFAPAAKTEAPKAEAPAKTEAPAKAEAPVKAEESAKVEEAPAEAPKKKHIVQVFRPQNSRQAGNRPGQGRPNGNRPSQGRPDQRRNEQRRSYGQESDGLRQGFSYGQPVKPNRPNPNAQKPATPAQKPATPVVEKTVAPVTEKPVAPVVEKTVTPVAEKPIAPVVEKPAPRPTPTQTSLFGSAVEDIRQAISLGDRFLFQRELFAGNGELMQKTLDELNGLGSLSEAMEYVAETFDWDKESTAVQLFENVLKRRFA